MTDAPDGTRWVGLSAVRTADQDAGRALCEALLAWGAARGATRGYVRVLDDDHAAAGLAQSGFRTASPRAHSNFAVADPVGSGHARRQDGGDSPHLRLATWNVNSIRTRLDRVLDWLKRAEVDVLAMQETKCADDQFPTMPFLELGYEVAHCGFNQWNGVAIASRVGLDQVEVGFDGQPSWSSKPDVAAAAEARALAATCAGVRVWSLYVPNGRAVGDPHYTYKLDWLAALRDTAEVGYTTIHRRRSPSSATGISPQPTTTSGASNTSGAATHVSEPERKAFDAIVDAQFTDVVRPFTPGPGVYTYWDYTQLRFPKRQGMRIDFILASPALAAGSLTRRSSARSVKARRPATTRRFWWICAMTDAYKNLLAGYSFPVHLPDKVIGLPDAAQYRDGFMNFASSRVCKPRQCGMQRVSDSRPQRPTIRESSWVSLTTPYAP